MAFFLVCHLPKIIAFLPIMTPSPPHKLIMPLSLTCLIFFTSLLCSNWRATHHLLFTSPWIWVMDCGPYQLQFSLHWLNRQGKTAWQSLYRTYLPLPVTLWSSEKTTNLKLVYSGQPVISTLNNTTNHIYRWTEIHSLTVWYFSTVDFFRKSKFRNSTWITLIFI